ncbi:hypothetical protein V6N12_056412 [Hibiscus sabdariffa]|uniref:Uncharacterized protein n=1 Tax=Hibiscus sabdariffa TaxID=183260 RepID=A0ABR2CSF4_9ROSI
MRKREEYKNWLIRGRKVVQMKKVQDMRMRAATATKLSKCGGNGGGDSKCGQMNVGFLDEADGHRSVRFRGVQF